MEFLMMLGASKVFEVAMLVAFGTAWPFSIYKSYKSKSTKGKSAIFLVVLVVGYICGILNKWTTNAIDYVVWFYVANLVMVSVDLCLYFRSKRYERSNNQ